METQLRTVDTILSVLQNKISQKEVVDATMWIDAAEMLNVLLGEETDKLFELQQLVAKEKVSLIEETHVSVSQAKVKTESLDIYKDMCKQKAKIERVVEFIRIAKIQSKLKSEEYKGY